MKEKIKAKLKSYGFWVSLSSAVMVFLNTLGLKVDIPYLSQVTTAFLSILVIAGILTKPGDSGSGSAEGGAEDTEEETAEENAEETAESRPDGETSESGEAETGAPENGEITETGAPENGEITESGAPGTAADNQTAGATEKAEKSESGAPSAGAPETK